MDRDGLATALRNARERIRPRDVGLPAGTRRRVPGLRREEVAQLAGISVDYLVRLEQARGPHPSDQVLTSLARALRLSTDERDHLFHLAGVEPPRPGTIDGLLRPSTLRLLDRLTDLPALVLDAKGDVLAFNELAVALLGDLSAVPSRGRNLARLWDAHIVEQRRASTKTIEHPTVGPIELDCDVLHLPDTDQRLVVYSAAPDTPASEALALLRVVGSEDFHHHQARS